MNALEVVPISRSAGVDVITGEGLADAVTGADAIIDVTAGPSSEQRAATEFFTTAARNLQQAGDRAGVSRYVVVSIVGIEKSAGGSLLPGPHAKLAGPTFEKWLTGQVTEDQPHRRLLR